MKNGLKNQNYSEIAFRQFTTYYFWIWALNRFDGRHVMAKFPGMADLIRCQYESASCLVNVNFESSKTRGLRWLIDLLFGSSAMVTGLANEANFVSRKRQI